MADPVPTVPAVTDRRTPPRGVLPRGMQTWLMAGIAFGVLAIIVLTGRPEPAPRRAEPPAAAPVPPSADRLTFRAGDGETVRYFPDKLPIGVGSDGSAYVFLYLLNRDLPVDFRAFLERHAELLRLVPDWTLRLLVPRHKTEAIPVYQAAFRQQITTPLEPAVADDTALVLSGPT